MRKSLLLTALLIVSHFALLGAGFLIGAVFVQLDVYSTRYQQERVLIEPLLKSDPAFGEIECSQRSDGWADLRGAVPSQADWDRLREHLIRAFGERRAEKLMSGVHAPK